MGTAWPSKMLLSRITLQYYRIFSSSYYMPLLKFKLVTLHKVLTNEPTSWIW
jgi:hypothetical protein